MATTKKNPKTTRKSQTSRNPTAKKPTAKKGTTSVRKPQVSRSPKPSEGQPRPQIMPKDAGEDDMQYFTNTISQLFQFFLQEHQSNEVLTGTERRRLMGAGVRNYGFIEKSLDVARENPELFPVNFNTAKFALNVHQLDVYRQLFWVLEKFTQAVNEAMLLKANASMHDALRVYRILQELTRSRVHGAEPLFRALHRFFERPRHPEQGEEPTIPELERDFNRIIHGKEDGEIIVKNKKPTISGGVHEVIDNVHKDRAAFKETKEAEINE